MLLCFPLPFFFFFLLLGMNLAGCHNQDQNNEDTMKKFQVPALHQRHKKSEPLKCKADLICPLFTLTFENH